jgi:hypothetical protein
MGLVTTYTTTSSSQDGPSASTVTITLMDDMLALIAELLQRRPQSLDFGLGREVRHANVRHGRPESIDLGAEFV